MSESKYTTGSYAPYTWSARFEVSPRLSKDDIVAELGAIVARQANPLLPLSGMISGKGAGSRNNISLGLDPSKTFGTPSVEDCEQLAATIEDELVWSRLPEIMSYDMRMFIGLRPGYNVQAKPYDIVDLQGLVTAQHVGRCLAMSGDVFSLRYVDDKEVRSYDEPGAVVYTDVYELEKMLHVAHALNQERVVAETFGVDTQVYQRIR